MKPIIVMAPEHVMLEKEALLVRGEYVKPLRAAGAVVLGAGSCRQAEEYVKFADALLLPDGGSFVHASRYGKYDQTFQDSQKSMTVWDDLDFALCRAFLKAGKPVLGIGRGAHVVNAALGGTLNRDLQKRLIIDGVMTRQPPNTYVEINRPLRVFSHQFGVHDAFVSESALLEERNASILVNSYHQQGIEKLGEGLKATVTAPDGTVEAFEHESKPVFGVQWHPEHSYGEYQADGGLFARFVDIVKDAAAGNREKPSAPPLVIDGGPSFDRMFETPSWIINSTYVNAVSAGGGLPLLAADSEGAEDYAKVCGGLVLTGSFSWVPRQELQPMMSGEGTDKRTRFDEALFRCFKETEKPICGICLGEQMMNLFMGGSLSFNFKFKEGHEHMMSEHEITAVPGSVLYRLYGERFLVNSRHNNRIERLADGLRVTASADDGTIEAVEHVSLPIWGFQFHPERMRGDLPDPPFGPDTTPLFAWFADQCRQGGHRERPAGPLPRG